MKENEWYFFYSILNSYSVTKMDAVGGRADQTFGRLIAALALPICIRSVRALYLRILISHHASS